MRKLSSSQVSVLLGHNACQYISFHFLPQYGKLAGVPLQEAALILKHRLHLALIHHSLWSTLGGVHVAESASLLHQVMWNFCGSYRKSTGPARLHWPKAPKVCQPAASLICLMHCAFRLPHHLSM